MMERMAETGEGSDPVREEIEHDFTDEELNKLDNIVPGGFDLEYLKDAPADYWRGLIEEDDGSAARAVEWTRKHPPPPTVDELNRFAGWLMVVSSILFLVHAALITIDTTVWPGWLVVYFVVALSLAFLGLLNIRGVNALAIPSVLVALVATGWWVLLLLFTLAAQTEVGTVVCGGDCVLWLIVLMFFVVVLTLRQSLVVMTR